MSENSRFKKLLEPGFIGKVRTRNRIVKNGTGLGLQEPDHGFITERQRAFYDVLAQGGAGLISMSSLNIDFPLSSVGSRGYRIDDEKYLPGL